MSILKNWFTRATSDFQTIDSCKSAQRVISKYGYSFVCPEDMVEPAVSSDPYCAEAQQIVSKYGYSITCPE